eukprot:5023618-Pyramimonas_sp.AAC.1
MLCYADQGSLYNCAGLSPVSFPFKLKAHAGYLEECRRCENIRTLSKAEHGAILPLLARDKRDKGGRGRCLVSDVPDLGLRQGGRLEPCAFLPDIGKYEAT